MREIKFRAWDMDKNKMYKVDELKLHTTENAHIFVGSIGWLSANKGVVMQYTGLKDKNGKEIYEGDIVRNVGSIVKIVWATCAFVGEGVIEGNYDDWLNTLMEIDTDCEVIGNIYENPELLEE